MGWDARCCTSCNDCIEMKKLIIIAMLPALLLSKTVQACELGCMLGISLGLHVMAAGIAISQKPTPENPTAKPFVINLAPKAPASSTVPAGWAAGASQYDTPIAPAFTAKSSLCPDSVTTYSTSGSCSYSTTQTYSLNASLSCDRTVTTAATNGGCSSSGSTTTQLNYVGSTSSCTAGYTVSGSNCGLTNPDAVPLPSDGQKVIERKGNELASPRDTNDAMPAGATQPTPNNVNYAYPDGGYVDVSIDPTTGKTTITNSVYNPETGTTKTETAVLGAPSSSSSTGVPVESYSSGTTNGVGSPNGTNGGQATGSTNGATGADIAALGNSINNKLDALDKADTECKNNPERAGCKDAGTMDDNETLVQLEKNVSITPISVSSVAGSCPAPLTYTASNGFNVSMSYDPVCSAASSIRPIVIALAWLAAALLVFGGTKE
jgi:hypothetical protein